MERGANVRGAIVFSVGGNRVERYVRSEVQRRDFVEARCKRIKNEQRLGEIHVEDEN